MRTFLAAAAAVLLAGAACSPDGGSTGDGGGDGRPDGGACYPGRTFCDGLDVRTCGADGESSTVTGTCDSGAGETCDDTSGICITLCAQADANRSNIGCEYWAVDLDNAENFVDFAAYAQFAVAVANLTTYYVSDVTVERDVGVPGGAHDLATVDSATIAPGELHVFDLPRLDVDGDNATGRDDDPQTTLSRRVYRLTATVPVVAYQFNPIDQAFSNGSTILLPTSGLDVSYYVVDWPPANPMAIPGFIDFPNRDYVTVVGVQDGTTVWVTPSYDIFAGVGDPPIDAIAAGTRTEFRLDRFDVLNLETRSMTGFGDALPDLTGTTVEASVPVAVFTGVDLGAVGDADHAPPGGGEDMCCAEHMESQIAPTSSMGNEFVVSRSPVRSRGGWEEYDYYRVMAIRPDTTVTTSLPDAGLGSFTLGAREVKEFAVKTGFTLSSSLPVHVVQFLVMRDMTAEWRVGGDSEMVYFPPVEQRRTTYVFCTGEGFAENWAVVSMPQGESATIDGLDVASTCGAPRTDGVLEGVTYVSYFCRIEDGRHEVEGADGAVGVVVYGYYNAGSYGYPAGSDLRRIFFG